MKRWSIKHAGMIEWYVDAIIAYVAIHSDFLPKIDSLNKEIKDISLDSKNLVSNSGFKKIVNSSKASYLNYSKEKFNNLFDINKVSFKDFPKNIDIFTYSFPCQDLSVQGLQKGINKDLKTHSSLLWQVERILLEAKNNFKFNELPKYLLMENVANILSKKHKQNFDLWLKQLNDIGYESKIYKLNSQDFGSCQNRTRVFCLSVRKDFKKEIGFEFIEFFKRKKCKPLKDILDIEETNYFINLSKYKLSENRKTKNNIIKKIISNYTKFNSENYVYCIDGCGPTLTASGANSRIKMEIKNNSFRYMTPQECFRYMGFSDNDYQKVKNTSLLSDSKIIFVAGNSISIEVLEAIFSTLKFGVENGKI